MKDPVHPPVFLNDSDLLFMAFAAGLSVASIYYNQPMLEAIRASFASSAVEVGIIPTATQLGYAAGMLLFIPMGDLFERVRLMQIFNTLAALSLLAMSASPNLRGVLIGSFAVGATTMMPQILLPYAAHHVREKDRGRALGLVLSGLLLGILLARTAAGLIGSVTGWRGMFAVAGVTLLPLTFLVSWRLPRSQPHYDGSYLDLMKSLGNLFVQHRVLREAALIGACLFSAFSAFWSTLIFLLAGAPYHWDMRAAGLFGLLGAAGALGAPLAGRFVDRVDPRWIVAAGLSLSLVAFAMMAAAPASLVVLIVAVLILDLGVQAAHVANQSRIFALDPAARSRINTIYMFSYFCGGALGSTLAALAWTAYGWIGVCGLAITLLLIGLLRLGVAALTKG